MGSDIVVAVGAVVVRHGRLLLVQRGNPPGQGLWAVPGGRLEHGETLAEGTLRELAEETGLTGRVTGICGIAERIGGGMHLLIHDLWVQLEGEDTPVAGDDAVAVTFASRADMAALPLVPGLEEFLREHGVWDLLVP